MTRPGAAKCHSCRVVTPYSEMGEVRNAAGNRMYWVCAGCLARRRKLRIDREARGETHG